MSIFLWSSLNLEYFTHFVVNFKYIFYLPIPSTHHVTFRGLVRSIIHSICSLSPSSESKMIKSWSRGLVILHFPFRGQAWRENGGMKKFLQHFWVCQVRCCHQVRSQKLMVNWNQPRTKWQASARKCKWNFVINSKLCHLQLDDNKGNTAVSIHEA